MSSTRRPTREMRSPTKMFGRAPAAPIAPPPPIWPDYLYLAHVLLEIVLGAIKLRGRYSHEVPGARTPRDRMYVRHHAFSLLSLALLGYLVWKADMVDTQVGRSASLVLFVFHGGACVAFTHAWLNSAIKFGKIIVPHGPFALLFGLHAAGYG